MIAGFFQPGWIAGSELVAGQRQKRPEQLQGHRPKQQTRKVTPPAIASAVVPAGVPAEIQRATPPAPTARDGKVLRPEALERWLDFWTSPPAEAVDMRADAERLYAWIRAVNERYIVQELVANARLVRGSKDQLRMNPLVNYLQDLTSEVERAEQHFGMTPLSRFRLGIEAGTAALTADEVNRRLNGDRRAS